MLVGRARHDLIRRLRNRLLVGLAAGRLGSGEIGGIGDIAIVSSLAHRQSVRLILRHFAQFPRRLVVGPGAPGLESFGHIGVVLGYCVRAALQQVLRRASMPHGDSGPQLRIVPAVENFLHGGVVFQRLPRLFHRRPGDRVFQAALVAPLGVDRHASRQQLDVFLPLHAIVVGVKLLGADLLF